MTIRMVPVAVALLAIPALAAAQSQVEVRSGSPSSVTIETDETALLDGWSFSVRVKASAPVVLERVTAQWSIDFASAPHTMRVVVFDPELGTRTFPVTVTAPSHALLAAANPDGTGGLVAVVQGDDPLNCTMVLAPVGRDTATLTATFSCDGDALDGGDELVLPPVLVRKTLDTLRTIEELLPALDASETPARSLEVVQDDLAAAESLLDPFIATTDRRLVPNPAGRPLDLFASEGRPSIWIDRPGADGSDGTDEPTRWLALINWYHESVVRGVRFDEIGLSDNRIYRVVEQNGATDDVLGDYTGGIGLPLRPRSAVLLAITDVGQAPSDTYSVWLIPGSAASPGQVVRADPDDAGFHDAIASTLATSGIVIASHLGSDVLHLPCAEFGASNIVPYAATAVAEPRSANERRFALRSSNVEWLMGSCIDGVGGRAGDPWFVCHEAGFEATPLNAVLADGVPAAAGFVVVSRSGLVVLLMNATTATVEELIAELSDPAIRKDWIREVGRARAAVQSASQRSGLFEQLHLDPLKRLDLIPGNPNSKFRWTAAPLGNRFVRTLLLPDGRPLTELVMHMAVEMPFVVDIPQPLGEDAVVLVLRRASVPRPSSYRLTVNDRTIATVHPDESGPGENQGLWQEDVIVLPPESIGTDPRVAMSVIPEGGTLAIARMGFFLWPDTDGVPVSGLDDTRLVIERGTVRRNRSACGSILRVADDAFLSGLGALTPAAFSIRLDGKSRNLVGRAGVNADTPDGAAASLRILGRRRDAPDSDLFHDVVGAALASFVLDVEGLDSVLFEITALDSIDVSVDIVDVRLLE